MKVRQASAVLLTVAAVAAASGCSTKAPGGETATGTSEGQVAVGRGVSGDTIKLGVLTDLTGPFAALSRDITGGHDLFWEQQNAGDKVCGKYTIELDTQDTGYVPQRAVQLYTNMSANVLAMQHTVGSPINTALADQYVADSMVNIPSAWARNLTEPAVNGVVGATYDVEITNALSFALGKGLIKKGDTLGHIFFTGEYGANALAGTELMATKHDFEVLKAEIKPTDVDMSSQIVRFKAAGVDAILLSVAPAQLASVAVVAAAEGLKIPLIGNNPVFSPGVLQGPAAATLKEHLLIASPVSSFDKHPELLAAYKAKEPKGTPSLGVVFGAGMAKVMHQILEQACANGDLTPQGMLKAKQQLTDVDTDGLVVPLNFSESGKSPSTRNFILQPADVPGGAKALTEAIESPEVSGLS